MSGQVLEAINRPAAFQRREVQVKPASQLADSSSKKGRPRPGRSGSPCLSPPCRRAAAGPGVWPLRGFPLRVSAPPSIWCPGPSRPSWRRRRSGGAVRRAARGRQGSGRPCRRTWRRTPGPRAGCRKLSRRRRRRPGRWPPAGSCRGWPARRGRRPVLCSGRTPALRGCTASSSPPAFPRLSRVRRGWSRPGGCRI